MVNSIGDLERASSLVPTDRSRPRLLLIEDDEAVARAMRRLLARTSEVEIVSSAEAAEERLAEGARFDLIVCDLLLEGKSGAEFYQTLRSQNSPMAARVVFLSGYGENSEITRSIPEVPCLSKPIQAARLYELALAPVLSGLSTSGSLNRG